MPKEFIPIPVPKDIEADVAIFVEQLKKQGAESGNFAEDDIELFAPISMQFTGPELDTAILYIATSVGAMITKAWLEKWVVPIIVEKTDPHRFLQWVKNNFPAVDRERPSL